MTKLKKRISTSIFRRSEEKKLSKLTPEQSDEYSSYTKLRVSNKPHLVFQQLYALLLKRFHRVKRNFKGFVAEILVPIAFVCLALLVATLAPTNNSRPSLELHPWYYATPNRMFISKSSSYQYDAPIYDISNGKVNLQLNTSAQSNYERVQQVADTFFTSPGPGTRCMNGHRILVPQSLIDIRRSLGSATLDCKGADVELQSNYTMPSGDVVTQLNSRNFSYTKISPDCDCSSGFPQCQKSAGGDIPNRPISILKTFDYIYDLSGRNVKIKIQFSRHVSNFLIILFISNKKKVTDWLIKTELFSIFFKRRYGGFEFLKPSMSTSFGNASLTDLFASFAAFSNNVISLVNTTNPNLNITLNTSYLNDLQFVGTNPLSSNENVKIWYNTKGFVSSVGYLNVLNNALLRSKENILKNNASDYGKDAIFLI